MLKVDNNKIGFKEILSLVFIIIFTKFTDDSVTIFFKECKNAGWMVPFISALVMVVPVIFIMKLLKLYEDKGLIQIIYSLLGNYIGYMVCLIILILNILVVIINIRDNCNTLNTLFYPRTSYNNIIFFQIGISSFIATLGIKASARSSWMLLLYIQISIILLVVACFTITVPSFIFPLVGSGVKNVLISGIKNSSIFQGVLLISIFYPIIENHKSYKKASLLGLLIMAVQLGTVCMLLQMVLDYPAVSINRFPLYTVIRLINITRFINNLEVFFLLPSTIAQTIYYSIYLYMIAAIFTYMLKLENVKLFVIPISALIITLSLLPENSMNLSFMLGEVVTLSLTITAIMLPVVLFIISKLKGDFRSER